MFKSKLIHNLKSLLEKLGLSINSHSSRKLFVNTGWLFFERILTLLTGLFIGVWVTRFLGPEDFGLYSYVLSFSVLFTSIASFGIDEILIRDLVKFPDKKSELISTGFFIKILGSIVTFSLSIIAVFTLGYENENTGIFIFIVVGSTIFQCFTVIDLYFQSIVESKKIVKVNSIRLIIIYGLKVLFILLELPLMAFVLLLPLEGFIRGSSYIMVFRANNLSIKTSKFSKDLAKSMIGESWPLILSGFAISMGLRIDQLMIKEYLPIERLGIYSIGVGLAELTVFLPMIIMQSLYPKIITALEQQKDEFIEKIIRLVFYFICLIALVISILSEFIVETLYGVEFKESYKVLRILIWTIPLTFLGMVTNKLLTVKKFQKTILFKQISLTVLNVSLNFLLIPTFGIIGAAYATLFADFFINFFMDIFLKNARWIFFMKLSALTTFKYKR